MSDYTVQAGDSLSRIAQELLGDASRYPEIAALNGIDDPSRIGVGQELKIPGMEAEVATTTPAQTAPTVTAAQSAPAQQQQAETYKIQSGDTLYAIAERELGDGNRYREIAELNGISNPNAISVGQELQIPGQQVAAAALSPEAQQATVVAGATIAQQTQTTQPVATPTEETAEFRGFGFESDAGLTANDERFAETELVYRGDGFGLRGAIEHFQDPGFSETAVEAGGDLRLEGPYGVAAFGRYSNQEGALAALSGTRFFGEFDNTRLTLGASAAEQGGAAASAQIGGFGDTPNGGTYNYTFTGAHNPGGGQTAIIDGHEGFSTGDFTTILSVGAEYNGPEGVNAEVYAEWANRGEFTSTFGSGQLSTPFNDGQGQVGGFGSRYGENTGFKAATVGVGGRYSLGVLDLRDTEVYGAAGVNLNRQIGAVAGVETVLDPHSGLTGYLGVGNNVFGVSPGSGVIPTADVNESGGAIIGAGFSIPFGFNGSSSYKR